MNGPRIGSLFSGYGGIDRGLSLIWPDARTVWTSDIKPGAIKVLENRFPDAPNLGDITTVDWLQVEPVDIITGGSPCQDLSHAGKRAGMMPGTRSGLWASMCDAIETLRPSLVIWENVRGALSATATTGDVESCGFCVADDDGQPMRALGRVLGDLADIGYDTAWVGLRAADVGACHGRFRVFVLAWLADSADIGRAWTRSSWAGRHRLADSSGDAVALLPTTTAQDSAASGGAPLGSNVTLTDAMVRIPSLMPTPQAHDQRGGKTREQVATMRAKGHGVRNLNEFVVNDLLPTPAVNDMGEGKTVERWDEWTDAMKERHGNGNGHGKSLSIEAQRLAGTFGQYAPAIARHELMVGRQAPSPTEPTGKHGANRLSPKFTEFMMGLPDGWVTDVPSVTRTEALSMCGDGVVPQQCAAAVRWLLGAAAITGEGIAA